jgi:predicted metal-dependent hydrolase
MARSAHSRPTVVGYRTIILSDHEVSYLLKRSQRARSVRLEVSGRAGLVVVVPRRYSLHRLPDLLRAKRAWVLRKLAEVAAHEPSRRGTILDSGDALPYLGRSLELVIRRDAGRGAVHVDWGRLIVSLDGSRCDLHAAIERWYRARAESLLREKAEDVSSRLGLRYGRLTIRGQRTRWGSCSHKGNLSFNWKLMAAPEPVVDYVVAHEVAHLREMNHSKRFWAIVASVCPGWRASRQWLKEHERALASPFPS